ncbi:MAG: diphthine synthase [Candidatus Diapherotrites archaeon]
MLYLIGAGLKPEDLTLEELNTIKKCSKVYAEEYTSVYAEGSIKELQKIIGKRIILLERKDLEERSKKIIKEAKAKDLAIIIIGNAFYATTHIQLMLEAKKMRVKFKAMPGISLYSHLGGTGLSAYNFGRTVSIVFRSKNYSPESFYDAIKKNLSAGLHTLCLLDLKPKEKKFMKAKEGLKIIEEIEEKRDERNVRDSIIVGLYGIGGRREKMAAGNFDEIKNLDSNVFPQSFIVCAKPSEKELEGLKEFCGLKMKGK